LHVNASAEEGEGMPIVLRVAVLLIAGVTYPAFALAQAYHVIDINAPEGFELLVTGLNNRNEVVGHVFPRRLPSGGIRGPMDAFRWDAANGFRILGLGEVYPGIDDAGAIYGLRRLGSINMGLFKWVNGTVEDLPTPPYPTVFAFKVKRNGDVYATNWVLHSGVWYDLKAISGFDIVLDVNEQGVVAGCVNEIVLNRSDPVSRPVLRLPTGRVFHPWDEGCVRILGAGGHFGGFNITPSTGDPDDYYYGTPNGRVSNLRTTDIMSFKDMNRRGVLLGSGFATQFVFAGETVTDLVSAPTSTGATVGRFVAVAINDLGYIAGFREVFGVLRGVLLVPVPSAPSPLTSR
jgi:hypothetical protein